MGPIKLGDIFWIREATPFAAGQANPMGQAKMGGTASHGSLDSIEDMLRKVMAAGDANPELIKIINKFLVDITPFMDEG